MKGQNHMVANYDLKSIGGAEQSREVRFAGDYVSLVGQIDYPANPAPAEGYPLLLVLHHAGGNVRADYQAYAEIALDAGYAVFRWDKRGAGKSGAGGRGSTLNDTLNAYKVALAQPGVNRHRVILLAQGDGTRLLHEAYEAISAVQPPHAALLIANLLDSRTIVDIRARVRILIGEKDWISTQIYGAEAASAHNVAHGLGAQFQVAHNADRLLNDTRYPEARLHIGAKQTLKDWLKTLD